MASGFWESYRDPRWQKKRLEVMDAAGFECQECGTDAVTLNVHHRHYRKGAKAWEYEISDLVCLCETCHETFHAACSELRVVAGKLESGMLIDVLSYARGLLLQQRNYQFESDDTSFPITPDDERGMADSYGLFRGFDSSWITWHLHRHNRPFVATNEIMEAMAEYQQKRFKVIDRTEAECQDIDQLLVACTG